MALHSKKRPKVWIWKALDPDSGQLVDGECGPRNSHTLNNLLIRLEKRDVLVYLIDHFRAYAKKIEEEILVQSKAYTHAIERNNGRQRYWFLDLDENLLLSPNLWKCLIER